jgi:hypothetical protein
MAPDHRNAINVVLGQRASRRAQDLSELDQVTPGIGEERRRCHLLGLRASRKSLRGDAGAAVRHGERPVLALTLIQWPVVSSRFAI